MKILFLTQRVPYPPNKGDKLRAFNQLVYLSETHSIHLICLTENKTETTHRCDLLTYCDAVDIFYNSSFKAKLISLLTLPLNKPLTLSYFFSKRLKEHVEQKVSNEKYDLIFVYCSSMAQYVINIDDTPKIIDFVDVDSLKWQQYSRVARFPYNFIYKIESSRLTQYEKKICTLFDYSFLVSKQEVEDFLKFVSPCKTLTAVCNGVDRTRFFPSATSYTPGKIVFSGAMDYFANVQTVVHFAKEIFPLIQQEVPHATFTVVGHNPTDKVKNLAVSNPAIQVTGFVESILPYVQQADVFVAPMQIARGVQNKILEAMAMGVPVVTNSLGFEGINATPGKDLFVEDDPIGFAVKVIGLIKDKNRRSLLKQNGLNLIKDNYDWTTNLKVLEEVISKVTSKNSTEGNP